MLGFRMIGVEGETVDSPKKALEKIQQLLNDKEIGLILVGESLAKEIEDELLKLEKGLPVIVRVPDSKNPQVKEKVLETLSKTLGIHLT